MQAIFQIPNSILSSSNHKTVKGEKKGWKTFIAYLLSYTDNSEGRNLCPMASKGCAAACLVNSGNGGMRKEVREARSKRTELYLKDRERFMNMLYFEIGGLANKHQNLAIRLNGTTDLPFEKYKINGKNLFEHFPNVQFYDYTKIPYRVRNNKFRNYHLTFSMNEENKETCWEMLAEGYNVAAVFDVTKNNELPQTYKGYKVVDGDENDLRFLEKGKNVIVGLRYKYMTNQGVNNKEIKEDNDFIIKDF